MIKHICNNCIYKTAPESIRDFYIKTLKMPNLNHWGESEFEHYYWLCKNENVAKIDGVNNSVIHKPCIEYNKHSNCTYFRTSNAEDILPSTVELEVENSTVKIGDECVITVKVTPYTKPATETEEEVINTQDIKYIYTWYKNGRKLFLKKSNILSVDTSEEAVDEYYCVVTQQITDNGDGGNKTITVNSAPIVITVELKEETENSNLSENEENSIE